MSNKLYEETAVQDIADAIREKNGSADTYTVAQMGDAVRSLGVGGETNYKKYTGEIVSSVVGTLAYANLVQDEFLATIRDEETLSIVVTFDIEPTAYTIVQNIAFNKAGVLYGWGENEYQYTLRYGVDANINSNKIATPLCTNSEEELTGVGCVMLTAEGELRIYSLSAVNYHIRPSTYTVEVRW